MSKVSKQRKAVSRTLPKAPTGIQGLDQITDGGFPRGRPTLLCGSAGCGKTLLAMEFLVRGAVDYDEPGVFMAFEETAGELAENVRSLGFDLEQLIRRKKIVVDFVRIEPGEIDETGEYDLEGIFVRLNHAIDSIGAKRVVLDTVEVLLGSLSNTGILRSELRRLFRWLKEKGVTAVITGERGEGQLTRHGLEEYVSDCVILLDHRVIDQVSTRRLRVVKYRGTTHGTNEYPFMIDANGISVLPITSLGLAHDVGTQRVSSGIPALDGMLGGKGYYRGSSILVTGMAGVGKSSLAGYFAHAACARGERCLYFTFEESPGQIVRNLRSIDLHLEPWVRKGLLRIHATRATHYGLETHLVTFHKMIRDFRPSVVIFDPIDNLLQAGAAKDALATLTRLIDYLKVQKITALMTNLTAAREVEGSSGLNMSSLVDTWLVLRNLEYSGERNRALYVLKSRGMAHSNQIREFLLTDGGIRLRDVYIGSGGTLTGAARQVQEARERAAGLLRLQRLEDKQLELQRQRNTLQARILALRQEFEDNEEVARRQIARLEQDEQASQLDRERMAAMRGGSFRPDEFNKRPSRNTNNEKKRRKPEAPEIAR